MQISEKTIRLQFGYYTKADVMRICQVDDYNFRKHLDAGLIPAPSRKLPEGFFGPTSRCYYDRKQLVKLQRYFHKPEPVAKRLGLVSRARMAEKLGCSYTAFVVLVRRGRLPAPSHHLGSRQYYTAADIPIVRQAYQTLTPAAPGPDWHGMRADGYLTLRDLAQILGVPYCTLQVWIRQGKLPKPSHQVPGSIRKLYRQEDIAIFKTQLAQHGYRRCPERNRRRKGGA